MNNLLQNSTLFIGNLSVLATEQDVYSCFCRFGQVQQVRIRAGHAGRNNCGFAFVYYAHSSSAAAALATLNQTIFMGRAIRVQWAGEEDGFAVESREDHPVKINSGSVAVQVLVSFASRKPGHRVHEGILYSIFSPYGPILDVIIKRNNQHEIGSKHGLHSGYGFITFENSAAGLSGALAAVTEQRQHIMVDSVVYDCKRSRAFENYLQMHNYEPQFDPSLPLPQQQPAQQLQVQQQQQLIPQMPPPLHVSDSLLRAQQYRLHDSYHNQQQQQQHHYERKHRGQDLSLLYQQQQQPRDHLQQQQQQQQMPLQRLQQHQQQQQQRELLQLHHLQQHDQDMSKSHIQYEHRQQQMPLYRFPGQQQQQHDIDFPSSLSWLEHQLPQQQLYQQMPLQRFQEQQFLQLHSLKQPEVALPQYERYSLLQQQQQLVNPLMQQDQELPTSLLHFERQPQHQQQHQQQTSDVFLHLPQPPQQPQNQLPLYHQASASPSSSLSSQLSGLQLSHQQQELQQQLPQLQPQQQPLHQHYHRAMQPSTSPVSSAGTATPPLADSAVAPSHVQSQIRNPYAHRAPKPIQPPSVSTAATTATAAAPSQNVKAPSHNAKEFEPEQQQQWW